jgi:hypothetical protein
MTPIERIAPPSAEEFRERYVKPGRPVIVTGVMDSWPALQKWSLEYLSDAFGARTVPVARVAEGKVELAESGFAFNEGVGFGAFLARLAGGGRDGLPFDGYVTVDPAEYLPELLGDLRVPDFRPEAPWTLNGFWLSSADTRTPLHMDLPDNLFGQIVGRKKVTLFGPRNELSMYRCAPWSSGPQISRVDSEAPDYERFPRFRNAHGVQSVLGAGELLYIPRYWWHQMRSLETSVSVNQWWATGVSYLVVRLGLLYQRARKLRY